MKGRDWENDELVETCKLCGLEIVISCPECFDNGFYANQEDDPNSAMNRRLTAIGLAMLKDK